MMYPFCKYPDGTVVTFSNIIENGNKEEVIYVHFERPMEYGFDSIRYELPTYRVVYEEGYYSEEEKEMFKKILEKGVPYFYEWAREGGIAIA